MSNKEKKKTIREKVKNNEIKNAQKTRMKNVLLYVLAFSIPILIILTHIFSTEIIKGNYIINGENFLLADMASQYNSIYSYIWDVLRGNDSIFYSFGKSLGGNMASTIGYYAASPLNILYLFCSKIGIPRMTFTIFLIKDGLSSLFMYIFLNKKLGKKYSNIIFAITYALMAYIVNYYFNNMWLDVIALTPLIILGIDKLIENKSIWFYSIFLAIAIFSNYYIAYMLCIFCVIYFLYQISIKYKLKEIKEYKKIIGRFVLGSLIGGGLAMFFVLPSVLNLSEIMRFSVDKSALVIDLSNWSRRLFNDVLCKLYMGCHNTSSVLSRNRPNLYSGMLTIVLIYFYFCNRNIKIKERIISAIVLLFFILSFMIPHLNLFWQAGSFPNGYIGRYSFVFSFYLIYLAARCFNNLDKTKIRYFLIFILVYGLATAKIAVQYLIFMEFSDIIVSSIFVLIYLIILFLMMYLKDNVQKVLKFILLIVVIIELFLNFKYCFLTNKEVGMPQGYINFYNEGCDILNNLDDGFYRLDGNYRYSYLDSWICNNHTVTTSLSTNTGDLYRFWRKNGGSVTYTTINYDINKLPIFDALFGVKYIKNYDKIDATYYELYETIPTGHVADVLKKEEEEKAEQAKKKAAAEAQKAAVDNKKGVVKEKNDNEDELKAANKIADEKEKITKQNENNIKSKEEIHYKYIYKNPYALSLGFIIPENYKKIYNAQKATNSMQSINRLMKTLTGNDEDVLIPYKKTYLGRGKYKFVINNDVEYYYFAFDYDVSINWTVYDSIYINDKYVLSSHSEDIGHIKIKNIMPNSTIKVRVGEEAYPNLKNNLVAFYLDEDVFKKDIDILKQHQLQNVKVDGNKMSGTIDAPEDSVLFTSIPYEKGWRIYVDGKKTSYEKIADEFVGIRLTKGNHKIKMVYYYHHLEIGIAITIVSAIVLVLYEILSRKKINKK